MYRKSITNSLRHQQTRLLRFIGLLCIFLTGLLFLYEKHQHTQVYHDIKGNLKQLNQDKALELSKEFNELKRTVELLSRLPGLSEILNYAESQSLENQNEILNTFTQHLSREIRAVLNDTQHVLNIQFILNNGTELVRLDRYRGSLAPTSSNRQRSQVLYDLFKLGEIRANEAIYSFLNFSTENNTSTTLGQTNTISLLKSLKLNNGNVGLVLAVTVDIAPLISIVNTPQPSHVHTEHYLIDHNGSYISAPLMASNWFTDTNNTTPLSAEKNIYTIFQNQNYLFSSQKLAIFSDTPETHYYLFSGLPTAIIDAQISSERREFLTAILVCFVLIVVIAYLSLQHIRKLEKHAKEQTRYKAILENASDAILSIKQTGEIIDFNHAAEIVLGFDKNQNKNLNFFDFVELEPKQLLDEDFILNIIQKNTNVRLEAIPKNQHKNKRRLLITFCPLDTTENTGTDLALVVRDITHQRASQKKLEDMNTVLDAKVRKRTEELERQKQNALIANEAKSRFVANISHEIRTPLNGINGLLAMARDPNNIKKADEYLSLAQNSAESLNILINDLLDFSKIESGKLELNPKRFNLKLLLEQSIQTASYLIKDKPVELMLDITGMKVAWVFLDENRVQQILTNLLSNAIKFTNEGQIILSCITSIDARAPNQVRCQLQVSDSGIGITNEQKSRLFKPFSQASAGITHKFGGTGLGLSITKQLCELMHGHLSLESKSGEGSTFKVDIPSDIVRTKLSVMDDAPIILDKHTVWLCVKNDHVRRTLRNQLHSWQVNSHLVHHLGQIGSLDLNTSFNLIIIDAEFYSSDMHQTLVEQGFNLVYLKTPNEDANQKSSRIFLSKPVLPSKLLDLLQELKIQAKTNLLTGSTENNLSSRHPQNDAQLEHHPAIQDKPKEHTEAYEQSVIVVDDNEINRIVGKGLLSSMQVQIYTAEHGADAIVKLQKLPKGIKLPIILMDCQMPIMDGYTATQSIREGKAGDWVKSAPIIAMTADAMSENRELCKSAGMDDFIGKPFNSDELRTIITKWSEHTQIKSN